MQYDSMKYWNFMEDLLLNCNHKLFNVFDCVNFGFQQAQLLEEMDEEFGISDLMEEEFQSLSKSKKPVCSQSLPKVSIEMKNLIFFNHPTSTIWLLILHSSCYTIS